jgi:ABC-type dipeptide/oligopeptide/nickel transport system ATPase subunit
MGVEGFLRVEALCKSFAGRPVLRNASFTVARGRVLGLVGASGSGKSTLARCIAGFETADSGRIRLDGAAPAKGHVQLIFQEAAASLNPAFTAGEIVAEPLVLRGFGTKVSHRKQAADWLETVGIPRDAIGKRALAFSGGERQRLAIARALAAEPRLLILDESLSGLDVVLQAHIVRLLQDLRLRLNLTCILITHDLALARRLADDIAVMEAGEIVEHAPAGELFASPRHPRTRELLDASRWLALEGA